MAIRVPFCHLPNAGSCGCDDTLFQAQEVALARNGRNQGPIGVGTTDEVAPPSEPSRPISGTRLSSWWLISKGDQPTHPDSFRVRAMDGSCCQGGQQTPNTSGRFAYSRCASPI